MDTVYKSPAPFWFWNDELNKEELLRQVAEMHDKGVPAFIIHARTGLKTPYLSEEWFSCVEAVLQAAEKFGMKAWLYDEENFPSGYAGGKVLEKDPSLYGKHLKMQVFDSLPVGMEETAVALTEYSGKYYVFTCHKTLWKPAYTQSLYIDPLSEKATKLFIESTHQEYYKRFGKYFGNVIEGFFTDEPGFYNNIHYDSATQDDDTIVWTDDFAEQFYKRRGYDVREKLHHVFRNLDETSAKIRMDFFDVAGELYRERFLLPIKKYCNDHGVKSIGHLHMEDYMHFQIGTQGDFFKALDCLDFIGLDKIDQNNEKMTEKVVSSVAHMQGKNVVMSESFALSGWGLDFTEMKRIADYQFVRGVNFLVPHAFYYSIEDFRRNEAPPSQFLQNPYWKYYKEFSSYVENTCDVLQRGRAFSQILVYYPRETAIARYTPDNFSRCIELDKKTQDVALALMEKQLDFDFIDADSFLEKGCCDRELLIFPFVERLPLGVLEKALSVREKIIFLGDGEISALDMSENVSVQQCLAQLRKKENVLFLSEAWLVKNYTYRFHADNLARFVCERISPILRLQTSDSGIKYLLRKTEEECYYFIINEDKFEKEHSIIVQENKMPYQLDVSSGKRTPLSWKESGDGLEIRLKFAPFQSVVIVFSGERFALEKSAGKRVIQEILCKSMTVGGNRFEGGGFWSERGLPHYSGQGKYFFYFKKENEAERVYLELGRVFNTAEVRLNGNPIGVRIYPPFVFDIKDRLQEDNILEITVTNTMLNEFEKVVAPSGMEGKAQIVYYLNTKGIR